MSRFDAWHYNRLTAKYQQITWPRRLGQILVLGAVCGCWYSALLFYQLNDISKSPPHTEQTLLLLLDYTSRSALPAPPTLALTANLDRAAQLDITVN